MAEGYTAVQQDSRTLGALIQRLTDDLNRPDLQAQALEYVQDAIRFYQPKPFFFTEQDNSAAALWAPQTIYPQGSTLQVTIGGNQYAVVALNTGASDGVTPNWPTTIFTTPPPNRGAVLFVLPPVGTPGTVIDNNIMWANVGFWTSTLWTQLSTVYNVNTYKMPFGYMSPDTIEITTANLRRGPQSGFIWVDYDTLRGLDVIQPAPITAYPTYWSWYQQQVYLWPYPSGFFPLTVSFRYGPPVLQAASDANFWTQGQAEVLIRSEAARRMAVALLHDDDAAKDFQLLRDDAMRSLRSQANQQRSPSSSGIPASDW